MSWDPFIEIFNPGHRHVAEERNRKRIEAQVPGSEGNPLGVDLDKGVIHIVLPAESGPRPVTSSENVHDTDEEPAEGNGIVTLPLGLAGPALPVEPPARRPPGVTEDGQPLED